MLDYTWQVHLAPSWPAGTPPPSPPWRTLRPPLPPDHLARTCSPPPGWPGEVTTNTGNSASLWGTGTSKVEITWSIWLRIKVVLIRTFTEVIFKQQKKTYARHIGLGAINQLRHQKWREVGCLKRVMSFMNRSMEEKKIHFKRVSYVNKTSGAAVDM